ncbi:MAG: S8 family serine peptidase [Acidobacteriota bacterium]|jgi:subtilisin family serine protease
MKARARFLPAVLVGCGCAIASSSLAATPSGESGDAWPELVVLELEGEPAIEVWSAGAPAAAWSPEVQAQRAAEVRRHIATLEARQESVVASLSRLQPPVPALFRLQRVFNGIAVQVEQAQIPTLRALPGVKAVHPLPRLEPGLVSTAPLIGAPHAWGSSLTGQGVRIGIIDTGVDYLHKAFGGSGSYAGHVFEDHVVPWTGKVVGGSDFVGDDYNGSNAARPDGDPMDCNGHGTHVAGIAAGYGVTATGETYGGPWGAGTDLEALAIGPGVAPQAQIFALKVFGCTGSTGYAPAAIEWALDPNRDGNFSDRLDVVNLSLGSSFGAPGGVYATITENAARAGMIVVASAGNSGDTHFITGSPATADRVISVANSMDSTSFMSDVEITGPAAIAGRYPATEAGFGPNLARDGSRTGSLVYPSGNPRGCSAFSGAAAAALNGAIALIDRGDCTFAAKVRNAQNAGARGVVVVNNAPGEPIVMGASDADAQGITTPSMMISLADGDRIKAGLGGGTASATLSATRRGQVRLVSPAATDTMATSSSRGPRISDLALKPDLAAPGSTIFAPEARSGWAGRSLSGTSMAAPQVAGAMALLRQLHPSWSVEELKALVMNTATPEVWVNPGQSGPRHGAARTGAGRLDVAAAAEGKILAYLDSPTGPGRVGVSFGSPEVVVRHRETRRVRVVNRGDAVANLTVSYVPVVDQPGVEIAPSVSTLAVPANSSATLEVVLVATASTMSGQRGEDLSPTQTGGARSWLAEESGHLLFSAQGNPPVRLPVYTAPRRRATLLARQGALAPAPGAGTVSLTLEGQDLGAGPHPEALVTPLEWQFGTPGVGETLGGIVTDYPDRPLAQALVGFGVALPSPWTTPLLVSVSVEIDTNGDSRADWKLAATDAARAQDASSTPVDVFLARLCRADAASQCATPLPLNGAAADARDTAPFLTDVMVLYARVADLQLSAGTTIRYRVLADGVTTPWLQYDLGRPGVRPTGGAGPQGFLQVARRGASVPLTYDTARLAATGSRGVLLLHHHNLAGWRAQAIPVAPEGCALACSATVPEIAALATPVPFRATVETAGCAAPTARWEAGDGSAALTGESVTHTFASPGTHRWQLTVTAGATTCRRTGVISVVEELPRPARRVTRPRS